MANVNGQHRGKPDRLLGGRVTHEDALDLLDVGNPRRQSNLMDYLIVCCAGYAALIVSGCAEDEAVKGAGQDFDEADDLLDRLGMADAGIDLEVAKCKAVELLRQPQNRVAIDRIAAELLEHRALEAEIVETLMDIIDGLEEEDTLRIMREPW